VSRLPLAETLTDVLAGVLPAAAPGAPVRITSLVVDLPLEVMLARGDGAPELLANLPRWRWTTDFDARPGRLWASFHVEAAP
jgi:hypothetical protein